MNRVAGADPSGFYLYCFTRPDAGRADTVTEALATEALVIQDVAVIFARVPLEEWEGAEAEACLQDSKWLIPRALAHEQVVEAYLAQAPVLPVRFGAVFSSATALTEFVTLRIGEISGFLDRMRGFEEWAVKGILDLGRMEQWLTSTDAVLAERRRNLPESPGTRYFQEKRLKADLLKLSRQWGSALAETLSEELNPCAVEVHLLRAQKMAEADREMLFHAAFLVSCTAVGAFQGHVERLQEQHALQGLTLEISGPWPPYSFCPELAETPA